MWIQINSVKKLQPDISVLNVSISTGLPGQTGDGAKVSAAMYHLGLPSGVFVRGVKTLVTKKEEKT